MVSMGATNRIHLHIQLSATDNYRQALHWQELNTSASNDSYYSNCESPVRTKKRSCLRADSEAPGSVKAHTQAT